MYNHFGPVERSEHANAVADALVPALPKPRSEPWTISHLSGALAGLFAHLGRSSTVWVADAAFTVLVGPNVQEFRFVNHEKLFKELAARAGRANAEPGARAIRESCGCVRSPEHGTARRDFPGLAGWPE